MRVSKFDYELPPERIAQRPAPERDQARLMVLEHGSRGIAHRRFHDLGRLLRPGDLLVLNDTKVVPARLIGRKPTGGRVELLLLERLAGDGTRATWRCWVQASRPPALGGRLEFKEGLAGRVLDRSGREWRVELSAADGSLDASLRRAGKMPLPPYIRRGEPAPDEVDDRDRYQTVFATHTGAIAAPTAGLHFTATLLAQLGGAGIEQARLTLHVGPGTFLPVKAERVEDHQIHHEWLDLPPAVASAVEAARRRGGRVVAVGTTVVRALEDCADDHGRVTPRRGPCGLFIYPGFRFRVVDAMITNFHLPRSTLLMLVSAFAGRERILAAYDEGIRHGYRFYSYGDAMLIERS